MAIKVDPVYKNWLYFIFAASWCSGLTFFILNNFVEIQGEFGLQKHPLQFLFLKIHGGSAFFMMITFGFFLGSHIIKSWRVKPVRKFGVILTIIPVLLFISAYILYYGSGDKLHLIVSYFHFSLGMILPFILMTHIMIGKKKKKRAKKLKTNYFSPKLVKIMSFFTAKK